MNKVIHTILSRRSIRKFSDLSVCQEDLDLIVQCGLYAPSGGNHQEVRLIVIEKREVLDLIAAIAREQFSLMTAMEGQYWNTAINNAHNNPNYDFTFHAPVLIAAIAPINWPNGMADSANALQNMQLAAFSFGLGSCWINQLHWLTGNVVMRNYLEQFGLDQGEDIYGSIVIGHPISTTITVPLLRKENRIIHIK
jgi:nitroreductase